MWSLQGSLSVGSVKIGNIGFSPEVIVIHNTLNYLIDHPIQIWNITHEKNLTNEYNNLNENQIII